MSIDIVRRTVKLTVYKHRRPSQVIVDTAMIDTALILLPRNHPLLAETRKTIFFFFFLSHRTSLRIITDRYYRRTAKITRVIFDNTTFSVGLFVYNSSQSTAVNRSVPLYTYALCVISLFECYFVEFQNQELTLRGP